MKLSKIIFGKWAFRKVYSKEERRKPINKALFEVWSVVLANLNPEEQKRIISYKEEIFQDFTNLMNDENAYNNIDVRKKVRYNLIER